MQSNQSKGFLKLMIRALALRHSLWRWANARNDSFRWHLHCNTTPPCPTQHHSFSLTLSVQFLFLSVLPSYVRKTDGQLGSDIYHHPCLVQKEHISVIFELKSFLFFIKNDNNYNNNNNNNNNNITTDTIEKRRSFCTCEADWPRYQRSRHKKHKEADFIPLPTHTEPSFPRLSHSQ